MFSDYNVEPSDPMRVVPNPARNEVEKQLRLTRAELVDLQETYAPVALDYLEGQSSTMRFFTVAKKQIRRQITEAYDRIAGLKTRRKLHTPHIPQEETESGQQESLNLSTEHKHPTNILKIVVYRIDSDWVAQINSHHSGADDAV
jgi:hypothetical protein